MRDWLNERCGNFVPQVSRTFHPRIIHPFLGGNWSRADTGHSQKRTADRSFCLGLVLISLGDSWVKQHLLVTICNPVRSDVLASRTENGAASSCSLQVSHWAAAEAFLLSFLCWAWVPAGLLPTSWLSCSHSCCESDSGLACPVVTLLTEAGRMLSSEQPALVTSFTRATLRRT